LDSYGSLGLIEADADVVVFIFKQRKKKNDEEQGGSDFDQQGDVRKFFLLKRIVWGPTGEVDLCWLAPYTRFTT